MIEKMDPSSDVHGQEQAHVLKLAGVGGHEHSIAEGPSEDFAKMMQDFTAKNPQFDVNAAVKQMQQKTPANTQSNTQTYSVNGKPSDKAGFDAAQKNTNMPKFDLDDPEGMQNHFKNFASQIAPQLGQKVQAATAGQPTQDINMPGFNGKFNPADLGNHINNMMKGMNFNEAAELDTMLKIAGIRK
jgi:cell wall-associated NlpC family hydrolase